MHCIFWRLIHKFVNFHENAVFMDELSVGQIVRGGIIQSRFHRYYLSLLPPQIQRKYFSDSLVQFSSQTQAPVKVKK